MNFEKKSKTENQLFLVLVIGLRTSWKFLFRFVGSTKEFLLQGNEKPSVPSFLTSFYNSLWAISTFLPLMMYNDKSAKGSNVWTIFTQVFLHLFSCFFFCPIALFGWLFDTWFGSMGFSIIVLLENILALQSDSRCRYVERIFNVVEWTVGISIVMLYLWTNHSKLLLHSFLYVKYTFYCTDTTSIMWIILLFRSSCSNGIYERRYWFLKPLKRETNHDSNCSFFGSIDFFFRSD